MPTDEDPLAAGHRQHLVHSAYWLDEALQALSAEELSYLTGAVAEAGDGDTPLASAWRAIGVFAVGERRRRERVEHLLVAEADFAMGGDKGEQVVPPPDTGEG